MNLARLAHEKRGSKPVFEYLDLITYRRLRHVELVRGTRKASMSCGGFEGANRAQWRKLVHDAINLPYDLAWISFCPIGQSGANFANGNNGQADQKNQGVRRGSDG